MGPITFCHNANQSDHQQYGFTEARKMHEYDEKKCLKKYIFGSFAKENVRYK